MGHSLANGFEAYSWTHGIALLACTISIAAGLRLGRIQKRRGGESSFSVWVGMGGLIFWVSQQGYFIGVERDWANSLPLHLCDLAGLVGPLAILTQQRLLRTMLYFWAFGLTVWGLFTPALAHGPEHPQFWLFWLAHSLVLYYAVYDGVVNRYRPGATDWGKACLVTMAVLALLIPLNLANPGWNYGYVGDVEVGPSTPLGLLPAWPGRILGIQAAGAVMFAVVWLPWEVAGWYRSTA